MNELEQFLTSGSEPLTLKVALLSLLLAFALTQAIATVYTWTFRGMSYSRSFVQSIALGSIVAAMLMLAINNSVAAGLGIAGSLAIIRFRTAMRDPRDMIFVFAAMGAGIASGLRAYEAAIAGTVVFCLGAILLGWTEFGSQRRFDGLLRFQVPAMGEAEGQIATILKRGTRGFHLVTLRELAQGDVFEHAYQIRLPEPGARERLLRDLRTMDGISDLHLFVQDKTIEI